MYGRLLSWSRYQWKARWKGRNNDQTDQAEEDGEDEEDEEESSLVRCSSSFEREEED